jgi:Tim44-like domain.
MNRKKIETILIFILIIISLIYFVIDFSLLAVTVFIISSILLKFSYPIEKPIEKERKEKKVEEKKVEEKKEIVIEKEEDSKNVPLINYSPGFDEKEFLKESFLLYKDIQTNFMNFEYDGLMKDLGLDIYNQFSKQMKNLESKNKQSVRINISLDKIQTASFVQGKEYDEAVINLAVIEDKYMKGIEEGFRLTSSRVRYESCYNITLIKRHKKKIVRKCHICNEKVQGNPNKCPECNTMLLESADNWIMTDLKLVCSHSKKES